jgi:hypothetical protein
MIGMNFVSFLILLAISIVVSAVLHYVLKFYIRSFTQHSSFILAIDVIIQWRSYWFHNQNTYKS